MAAYKVLATLMLLGSQQVAASRQCSPATPNTTPICSTPATSVSPPLACNENLIQNPDFQTSSGTGQEFSTDGWTLCSKSPYSTIGSAPGPPNDSNGYALQLSTFRGAKTTVSFSQTFLTKSGDTYDFVLYYKVSKTAGTSITCSFNNQEPTQVTLANTELSTDWAQMHTSMVASGSVTSLSCSLEATSPTTAEFDQVQVSFTCPPTGAAKK